MEKESFKQLLKKADFNKRTFSQYLGLKYQSVNSWGNNGRNVPYWVESWLNLYIDNKRCKQMKINYLHLCIMTIRKFKN